MRSHQSCALLEAVRLMCGFLAVPTWPHCTEKDGWGTGRDEKPRFPSRPLPVKLPPSSPLPAPPGPPYFVPASVPLQHPFQILAPAPNFRWPGRPPPAPLPKIPPLPAPPPEDVQPRQFFVYFSPHSSSRQISHTSHSPNRTTTKLNYDTY